MFRLFVRRLIYFHDVEDRPTNDLCMGVYVSWTAYTETPVTNAETEHSKMLPMRNLAELIILEDVLTRKRLLDKELMKLMDESQTLQTLLTKLEISAVVAQATAGVEQAYGTTTDGKPIASALRDGMASEEDEEPLTDKRVEDRLIAKCSSGRSEDFG